MPNNVRSKLEALIDKLNGMEDSEMPTNEERREVAARLRDIGVKTWHISWHELYAIKNACGCYTGQDQHDVELKDRLADLIEPEERTCRFQNDGRGILWCDADGCDYDMDD